jgi:hypothetical protein
MEKLKSQVVIFENVMIFAISVLIFLSCYTVFTLYQSYYTSTAAEDQLNKVKDFISSNVISMAMKDGSSSVALKIPKTAGTQEYIIELSDSGLVLKTTDIEKHSSLFGLNRTYEFNGRTVSTKGRISIYKRGEQIIIM